MWETLEKECGQQLYKYVHVCGRYQLAGKPDTVQRETFDGENFHGSVYKVTISRRKFLRNAKTYHRWVRHTKTFAGGSKTTKLVDVFSLESFLLYSTRKGTYSTAVFF